MTDDPVRPGIHFFRVMAAQTPSSAGAASAPPAGETGGRLMARRRKLATVSPTTPLQDSGNPTTPTLGAGSQFHGQRPGGHPGMAPGAGPPMYFGPGPIYYGTPPPMRMHGNATHGGHSTAVFGQSHNSPAILGPHGPSPWHEGGGRPAVPDNGPGLYGPHPMHGGAGPPGPDKPNLCRVK